MIRYGTPTYVPTNLPNAFPVMTGDVVTEGHVRICREKGHATWTVDGVDQHICPRCGDVTA